MLRPVKKPQRDIYTVSRLNHVVQRLLASRFRRLWISGEISNFSCPSSGHWYFTLKDSAAQVRCAMFQGPNRTVAFRPEDGMQVLLQATVSLYEARGDYQLLVEHIEPTGDGALRQAYEQLKLKLAAAGLFDAKHKRPLPSFPKHIGIISSPHASALQDVLITLQQRCPAIPVTLYPAQVQGADAAASLITALSYAQRHERADVIIITRGGGSLEDLWPFNNEALAQALFNCSIPVISGVGHQTDITICDLVADRRAATPTASAQLVAPDQRALLLQTNQLQQRLERRIQQRLLHIKQQLHHLRQRLVHPRTQLWQNQQRTDELVGRLRRGIQHVFQRHKQRYYHANHALKLQCPNPSTQHAHLQSLTRELITQVSTQLNHHRQQLRQAAAKLHALSPLATLARGYAIATQNDTLLTSRQKLDETQPLCVRLIDAQLTCLITDIEPR